MALEIINNCPICNGQDFQDQFNCKDHTSSGNSFSIIKCKTCSLLITSPRPDKNSIVKHYESIDYISHSAKSRNLFEIIYFQARKIAHKSKSNIIRKYHQSGNILDIGCGTGSFLKFMKNNYWKTFGVEPSEKASQFAISTGLEVAGSIDEINQKNFDVITMWHVLEHIHDLNQTVEKIKEKLHTSATLFIAVPNHESFDSQFYKETWAAYDVPRHLWHFNQKSMRALLEKHQMQIIAIHPMKMDSYYVSLLSEQYINQNKSTVLTVLKALILGFRSNTRASKTSNYSSLIYVVKKS